MEIRRRISATFKDLPGGQVLGPTFDYTHRLLDPALMAVDGEGENGDARPVADEASRPDMPAAPQSNPGGDVADAAPHVTKLLDGQGLIEGNPADAAESEIGDLTRDALDFPAGRDTRLQALARGDEGFLLALGYSTQRGYGRTHPFAGEIRMGEVELFFEPEELGFEVPLGTVTVTECEMVNQFSGSREAPPQFTRGYGLVFGHSERKAMAMALVDRSLRARELGEEINAPAQDEEFVMSHSDNVQATGFVEHLKLPHYVDFQAELTLVRQMRDDWQSGRSTEAAADSTSVEETAE